MSDSEWFPAVEDIKVGMKILKLEFSLLSIVFCQRSQDLI